MPELVIFLFKVNLVLLLFGLAYFAILRKLTFYNLNRFFLLLGIILSSVYPFIDIDKWFSTPTQNATDMRAFLPQVNVAEIIEKPAIWENWNVWIFIFWIGLAYFSLRFAIQLISLYKLHTKTEQGNLNGQTVRILKENISPFSFWKHVYVNPELHAEAELNSILAHENIHVKEWHTFDIIVAEIAAILYWFNPGIWLMKKAVKENLEFIADERMVKKGLNKKQYQYSLLAVGQLKSSLSMVNHFNLSDLKRRIIMMNSKKSAPFKKLLYVFIIPFICLATLIFTFRSSHAVSVIEQTFPVTMDIAKSYVENINGDNWQSTELAPKSLEENKAKVKKVRKAKTQESTSNTIELSDKKTNFIMVRGIKLSHISDSIPSSSNQTLHLSQMILKGKPDSLINEVVVQGKHQGMGVKRIDLKGKMVGSTSEAKFLMPDNVILKVNGIEVPMSVLSSIDPKDIQSVNVFKDQKTGVVTVKGFNMVSKDNSTKTQRNSGNAEIHIETIQK